MTQKEVDAVQFWLDTRKAPFTVDERLIRKFKDRFILMLNADIEANVEVCKTKWTEKRWKYIGFMTSLRDWLKPQ